MRSITLICIPIFVIGWVIGFLLRYFLQGWYRGLYYFELAEEKRKTAIIEAYAEHISKDDVIREQELLFNALMSQNQELETYDPNSNT